MLRDDSPLRLPGYVIREAFAMSKMTVVNELDAEGRLAYRKLKRVEFLEFLARIADLYFKESEMEELDLYEKIEHILDDLLPLIGGFRVKQEVTVEEFSESDDDY